MDELIVFLMREFGWTLEYTVRLVTTLPINKLNALIAEAKYQKDMENYQNAANSAMIIANWASAQSKDKKYKVSDFIGSPPKRVGEKEPNLYEAAEREGIILPKKEG